MEVKFKIDIKTARKVFAMLDVDIPSDEEITSKLEGTVIDLTKEKSEDAKQAELGFTMMAIGQAFDN